VATTNTRCTGTQSHESLPGCSAHRQSFTERRREPRVRPGPHSVRVLPGVEGVLLDLSACGALIRFTAARRPDERMVLHLQWSRTTLHLRARVVRSAPACEPLTTAAPALAYHVGVEFREVAPTTAAVLRQIAKA